MTGALPENVSRGGALPTDPDGAPVDRCNPQRPSRMLFAHCLAAHERDSTPYADRGLMPTRGCMCATSRSTPRTWAGGATR